MARFNHAGRGEIDAPTDGGLAFGGTPAVTFGTSYVAGVASTLLRTDDTIKFPSALMSTVSGETLTLPDIGSDQLLTGSVGILTITPATGITLAFPASTAGSLIVKPDTVTAATTLASFQGRPVAGTRTLIDPNWFGASASDVFTSQTFKCWNAAFSSWIAGQITGCTIVAYDANPFTIAPSASSGADNKAYVYRAPSFTINNANGSFAEVATAFFTGAERVVASYKADVLAGVIVECPTGCNKKQDGTTDVDQIGILVRQKTAEGTAPTNRVGLDIVAQNTGTNRYSIRALTDSAYLGGLLLDDSAKVKFGTGRDAELYYDGTDFVCDPDVVGGGSFDIRGPIKVDSVTNDTGLAAGVYTPTRSAEANMDANVTMTEAQYLRVGNTVTVSGRFTADPTLTATATSFEITLPVASNIGAVEDLAGVAFCGTIAGMGAEIIGVVANDTAVVQWVASDITSKTWSFTFSYQAI